MKKSMVLLCAFVFAIVGYRLCYPPNIIGIHQSSESIIVLVVEHFPWTKSGKIIWWQRNQAEIFSKLNIHESDYSVFIYNTYYQKDSGTDKDSDLLCFKDMPDAANCVSKDNRPLLIWHYPDGRTEYITENVFQRFLRHL